MRFKRQGSSDFSQPSRPLFSRALEIAKPGKRPLRTGSVHSLKPSRAQTKFPFSTARLYKEEIIFHCLRVHCNKLEIIERNRINDFQLQILHSSLATPGPWPNMNLPRGNETNGTERLVDLVLNPINRQISARGRGAPTYMCFLPLKVAILL